MSLATDLAAALAADARLYILQEANRQVDEHLSDVMARRLLDLYRIHRDIDWVRTQMRKLEALGAVELIPAGHLLVAKITSAGRDHLEKRAIIDGVSRPSEAS